MTTSADIRSCCDGPSFSVGLVGLPCDPGAWQDALHPARFYHQKAHTIFAEYCQHSYEDFAGDISDNSVPECYVKQDSRCYAWTWEDIERPWVQARCIHAQGHEGPHTDGCMQWSYMPTEEECR